MPMSTIAVVIVNYNGGNYLHACIAALVEQTIKADKIVVVDNGSSDDSVKKIGAFSDDVELIELNQNTGFARANNIAVRNLSGCDWIALLNPDAIPAPDWIEQLRKGIVGHPTHTSFACCMLQASDPETLDGAGDAYHVNGIAWPRYKGVRLDKTEQVPHETFSACGGAALYRRDVFVAQEGFDERYFCYHEDVDLGFRLCLAGQHCMYLPDAVVYHEGSAIAGKGSDFSVYHVHRNMVWTFVKNMPQPLFAIFLLPHIMVSLITILNFALKGRGTIILKAKWDAIKGLPGILRSRVNIQRQRRTSSSALLGSMHYGWLGKAVLRLIERH